MRATLTADRTPDPASYIQWMQPFAAFSEYTLPPQLPTNTRPPAIVACAYDCRSPGNPNAHLSFRRDTSAAAMPAPAASWNLVLFVFCPHPVQRGPALGLNASFALHIAAAGGVVTSGFESDLPVRNSAIARRSAAVRLLAIVTIEPLSIAASTRSAGRLRNTSRLGARLAPVSWHCAHVRL